VVVTGRKLSLHEPGSHARPHDDVLVHHSDRGGQYVSIRYTERLAAAGIERSIGSVGDSYDNALAETINGLYKTEVIRRRGPWRNINGVEFATLEWVDWFNNRRLLEPIGYVPPVEVFGDAQPRDIIRPSNNGPNRRRDSVIGERRALRSSFDPNRGRLRTRSHGKLSTPDGRCRRCMTRTWEWPDDCSKRDGCVS
jgi:hypothetical protein